MGMASAMVRIFLLAAITSRRQATSTWMRASPSDLWSARRCSCRPYLSLLTCSIEPIRPPSSSSTMWPPRPWASRCNIYRDARDKQGCELNFSSGAKKSAEGFRLGGVLLALCCAAVLGYTAGIRQPNSAAGKPAKTYVLNLGAIHLNLTVGAMGVLVIFTLTGLLAMAILLATVASRRRKQAEAANRGLASEIGERKRAQEEVNKLNKDLERRVAERTQQLDAVNKELEAFSYSVAHDLRAPLRHINGFSKIVEDDYGPTLDAEARHYLASIRNAAKNMGQ